MTTAVHSGLTDLVMDAQRYLRRILPGLASVVGPVAAARFIPQTMASRYHIAELTLYGETPAMLAVPRVPGESSSRVIQDVKVLRSAAKAMVLYVSPYLTPTQRRFLVENHIDFVVPHNQLYAPAWRSSSAMRPTTRRRRFRCCLRRRPCSSTYSCPARHAGGHRVRSAVLPDTPR